LLESREEAITLLTEALPSLPPAAIAHKLLHKLIEAAQLESGML